MRRLVRERRIQRFDDEDLDRDGNLTRAEFFGITAVSDVNAADPTLAADIFERLDEDGNNAISKEAALIKGIVSPVAG